MCVCRLQAAHFYCLEHYPVCLSAFNNSRTAEGIFWKFDIEESEIIDTFQFLLKLDSNNGHVTARCVFARGNDWVGNPRVENPQVT
jgi:hypothetical protein